MGRHDHGKNGLFRSLTSAEHLLLISYFSRASHQEGFAQTIFDLPSFRTSDRLHSHHIAILSVRELKAPPKDTAPASSPHHTTIQHESGSRCSRKGQSTFDVPPTPSRSSRQENSWRLFQPTSYLPCSVLDRFFFPLSCWKFP